MLQVEDLHAGYGASEVLTGTTLTVKKGTLQCVVLSQRAQAGAESAPPSSGCSSPSGVPPR